VPWAPGSGGRAFKLRLLARQLTKPVEHSQPSFIRMYVQPKRPRAMGWHAGAAEELLLAGVPGSRGLPQPLLEPLDGAAGVEDLLLARVERVAVRAHVGVDRAVLRGRPRDE